MVEVIVRNNNVEKALRVMKRKLKKNGLLLELKDRQYYQKPSEKKRLAKSAGRQRWLKKLRDTPGPHQQKTNYRRKRAH